MSEDMFQKAYANFSIAAEKRSVDNGVVVSGNVTNNLVLQVAFSALSTTKFMAEGLKSLSVELRHIEEKLNALLAKEKLPTKYP
jgi:hypothetical protein